MCCVQCIGGSNLLSQATYPLGPAAGPSLLELLFSQMKPFEALQEKVSENWTFSGWAFIFTMHGSFGLFLG